MTTGRALGLLMLLGLSTAACSSDDNPGGPGEAGGAAGSGGSGGTGNVAADAGPADAASACDPPVIPASELVKSAQGPSVYGSVFQPVPEGQPSCGIPGVQICVRGTTTCMTTGAAGDYVFNGLPADQNLILEYTKSGYGNLVRFVQMAQVPVQMFGPQLSTIDEIDTFFSNVGLAPNAEKGSFFFFAVQPGEGVGTTKISAGITADVNPVPVSGTGPFFSDPKTAQIDKSFTTTVEGGVGFYLNVDPGEYTVKVTLPGYACTQNLAAFGHGMNADNAIRMQVFPGTLTSTIGPWCQ